MYYSAFRSQPFCYHECGKKEFCRGNAIYYTFHNYPDHRESPGFFYTGDFPLPAEPDEPLAVSSGLSQGG
jgi:hypothetical protein